MTRPVAFVTGVSRGLGESLARDLAGRGFAVVGIGRSAAPALDAADFRLARCDLADLRSLGALVEPLMRDAASRRPAQAVLINNAALAGPVGRLGTLEDGEIAAALAVDLAAPALLANAFCRAFGPATPDRRVINVSSGAAERTLAGSAVYCAAKAGLEMLTRTLAVENIGTGFSAIAIRPGIIDTPMQAFMREQSAERLPDVAMFQAFQREGQLMSAAEVARRIVAALVLAPVEHGRVYRIADLAGDSS